MATVVFDAKTNKFSSAPKSGDTVKIITNSSDTKTTNKNTTRKPAAVFADSSTKSTPSPVAYTQPSFFSIEGQKKAIGRVLDVFTFNYDELPVKNPFTQKTIIRDASAIVKPITAIAEVGAAAYGASFLLPARAAAAATSAASGGLFKSTIPLITGIAGLSIGGVLFGQNKASNAPQEQTNNPTQTTQPQQKVEQPVSPEQGGSDSIIQSGQGNTIFFTRNQQQYTQTYNYATPTQTTTPQLISSPSQSQEATTSGTNWGLIAIAALGVYLLTKR